MGVSMRHVRRMAQSGALSYQIHMNAQNRPEYLFPLSSLPDAAQQKYFAEHAPAALPAATPTKAKKADKPAACKPLEAYTAEERGEIGYWITTVDRWQTYRNKAGTKKAECDEKFVLLCRMEEPDRQISVETLYRKWAAIREGDYGALVDMRGKARGGMSKMPEAIERVFLTLYLDDRQYPIPRCIDMTKQWAQEEILSPEDIQQLIKRPQMQGIGAVGNAGALFTCEKVFGYSQKNAEGWFKALKKKYPLYKGESGKIEDALAQRIAFAEELRRDGAKYGLIFSR